ncbi:5-deoxy-glucuronate isomerase, partial [Escherichia coli]|nr:5-deoxy-glucuronate isomerase [Escherichia coli]
MFEKLGQLKEGYNELTNMASKHEDMMLDIGIYSLREGAEQVLRDSEKETAVLLLEGKVRIEWDGNVQEIERESVFEEDPWCLH